MGFMDTLKAKLAPAKDKVSDLAQQHGGKIEHGLDKAAKTVDQKTKGKYSRQDRDWHRQGQGRPGPHRPQGRRERGRHYAAGFLTLTGGRPRNDSFRGRRAVPLLDGRRRRRGQSAPLCRGPVRYDQAATK